MAKLLLFGPCSIHLSNYLEMVESCFDDVIIISDNINKNITNYKQEVISFSIKNPFQNFKKIQAIKKIISEFKPDVIHLHNIGTGAFLLHKAVKKLDIPKIATAWGSDVLVSPQRNPIFRKILKDVLNDFDYFTSDSLYMAYKMKHFVSKDIPIEIANFGVDEVTIDYNQKEKIIYSNRLHENLYRIDLIIDLFFEFIERNKDFEWKLVIAATGSQTENLKQKVNNHKYKAQVEFVGWIDKNQNASWYKKARMYISIPTTDATSISLLEAMENGCIPIVSNLPANLEWITLGYNGVIFQHLKQLPFEEALSMNFERLVKVNKEIIQINGLKEANSKKYIALYKKIIL